MLHHSVGISARHNLICSLQSMSLSNMTTSPSLSLPTPKSPTLSTDLDPLRKRTHPRRFINALTCSLDEFPSDGSVRHYAILSHCWVPGQEVSYQEMLELSRDDTHPSRAKFGFQKISNACAQALQDGHHYIWVDTCCIDDGNHAHKSQDINSMFDYYANSDVCYVYLHDIHRKGLHSVDTDVDISQSKWFSRGWTLQELVAPSKVKFFTEDWRHYHIDSQRGVSLTEAHRIQGLWGISVEVLTGSRKLQDIGLKERMSWSIKRSTTVEEDRAYCLLGLLGVVMETRDREGVESAFGRLSSVLYEAYGHEMREYIGPGKAGNGRALMQFMESTYNENKALTFKYMKRSNGPCQLTRIWPDSASYML
ncbi:hypothetical protein D9758_002973 [Tetrapyrgos nigripes]|uniref:Heterokaryon incompatibility domain-containing protein n=1 Tax=Tetrapyrgos nigripes TaxID=182062 RepID=A0A8H5GQ01_9AGAR|nr:hypothetical protein D9758_002973 [Tetrapyrgos nigripes]